MAFPPAAYTERNGLGPAAGQAEVAQHDAATKPRCEAA